MKKQMTKNSPTLQAPRNVATFEAKEAFEFAALADAKNTQRAYLSDWKQFLAWCSKRNKSPLPASPNDVATYLRFAAEKLKLHISTVTRRTSAITEAHKRNGFESPCDDWIVKNTMKRLRRDLGTPARGKNPILVADLKEMVGHCPPTLSGIRDRAVLLFCFAGAFRRSELVNINIDDLTSSDEGLVVMIRQSKTDQKREGRKVAIPFGEFPDTCPIRALLHWVDSANLATGPLFRSMTKFERPRTTRMSDRVVAEIVKKYCGLIGKRESAFSGHSLRSGLATSAAIAGASEASIQKQTGHKSLLVLRRYIRDASLFRENAATKIGL
jgi:integrase